MFLITGPDVGANADCFSAVRVLHELDRDLPLSLIINRVQTGEEARDCMLRLRAISRRMIGREIGELGYVTESEVFASLSGQKAGISHNSPTGTSHCFHEIAEQVLHHQAHKGRRESRGLQDMAGAWRSRNTEKVAELASC
jgi:flagellar biosynthesis protein FlhG